MEWTLSGHTLNKQSTKHNPLNIIITPLYIKRPHPQRNTVIYRFIKILDPYQLDLVAPVNKPLLGRIPRLKTIEFMEPLHVFVDESDSSDSDDGYCMYAKDDFELLRRCWRPLRWNCVDNGLRRPKVKIYEVKVKAKSCTVEECLELLKRIGLENQFIACSVESVNLFFAELNKEDAKKLKGLGEIRHVFPRDDRVFEIF